MPYCNRTSCSHASAINSSRPPCLFLRLRGYASPVPVYLLACFLAASLYFFSCIPAQAHRVNIFAWTEGPQVQVQCGFSGGNNVKNGQITVYDAANGAILLEGRTDINGMFHFEIPPQGRKNGLRIRINAGEGHQNEWRLDAEELAQTAEPSAPSPAQAGNTGTVTAAQHADTTITARASTAQVQAPAVAPGNGTAITAEEIRASVDAALEAQDARFNALLESRLAPLRRQLAEMRQDGPGLKEIVGGMGWLVGLAGIALYLRSRHR
ncbi:cobalamin biosynthesis protein CbiL [Desulfovibrio sp.]|uniref:cobalamin biosynthesis protein CbiL n=1 Tax=Desulfovibrio sp. TaxID=885 RepID=UPI0025C5A9FE|nr:cobalamin biosynthesis protein CbiL [Desulfovibrio sp.]